MTVLTGAGCYVPQVPVIAPQYGMVKIDISDGQKIYVKRRITGIGGDHDIISISPSENACSGPNSVSDYVYPDSIHGTLLYKVENGSLVLYDTVDARNPTIGHFPIDVIQRQLTTLDYLKMKEHPEEFGLTLLEVPIDETIRCK